MRPRKFALMNGTLLGGPAVKYGTEEDVADLPVCRTGGVTISCWRPGFRERLSVLFFGRVWLGIRGDTHAPVYLVAHSAHLRREASE